LFPTEFRPLAAPDKYPPPTSGDLSSECHKCPSIGRHCVIVEVTTDNVVQPRPLIGNGLVHTPPHFLLNHLELCLQTVPSGLSLDLEFARAGLAADEREAQEVEGLRFAEPTPPAAFRRKTSELDQPGLLGMQRQRKLP